MAKEEAIEIDGVVENVLPNTTFRVHLPNGHYVLATIAGKMRRVRLPALAGGPGPPSLSPHEPTPRRLPFPPKGNPVRRNKRVPGGGWAAGRPPALCGANPSP